MRFDGGTVDENLRWRPACLRKRAKETDPDAFLRPSHEAIVERLLGAVFGRRIDPASARFEHMNDAADDAPVVNARLAARVRRQVGLDPGKLRVRQPEEIAIHVGFPFGSRESQLAGHANSFMGLDPNTFRSLTPKMNR